MWRWAEVQEAAFTKIKRLLTTKPVLQSPDFLKLLVLATDASKESLGACLMKDSGKGLQPVPYAIKATTVAEETYPISELECGAVVWAVKLFRPYLYGRQFVIDTDHLALK